MTHRFLLYVEGKFSDGTGRYAARCGHNLTELLTAIVREMEKYPGCDWDTLSLKKNVARDPNWLNAAREARPNSLSAAEKIADKSDQQEQANHNSDGDKPDHEAPAETVID